MKESGYVKVIEGKEVTRDDPIEYFLSTRVGLSTKGGDGN